MTESGLSNLIRDVAAATGPGGITRTGPQLEIGFEFRAMHQYRWRREAFCADVEAAKKTHAGTGGNKLLILYLVFAATITTRYRKASPDDTSCPKAD